MQLCALSATACVGAIAGEAVSTGHMTAARRTQILDRARDAISVCSSASWLAYLNGCGHAHSSIRHCAMWPDGWRKTAGSALRYRMCRTVINRTPISPITGRDTSC